jgi:hypothetical protein
MGKEEIDLSKYTAEELGYLFGRTFGRRANIYLKEIFRRALIVEESPSEKVDFDREKKK